MQPDSSIYIAITVQQSMQLAVLATEFLVLCRA